MGDLIAVRRFLFISLLVLCCYGLVPTPAVGASGEQLITVILPNKLPRYEQIQAAFLPALQAICKTSCRVYVQTPNADVLSLRNSVRKAVALDSRMIITYGLAATSAARSENPGIPVLFADVPDPETLIFGEDKAAISKYMTDVRGDAPLQSLLKFFIEASGSRSIAVLYEKGSPEGLYQRDTLVQAGERSKIAIIDLALDRDKDVFSALDSLPETAGGLFLTHSERLAHQADDILEVARRRHIPVISQIPGTAELGALLTLVTDPVEQGEQLAVLAGEVLASRKVSSLAVVRPRQVAFIINLKTAQALNLKVPLQTLTAATRIIR